MKAWRAWRWLPCLVSMLLGVAVIPGRAADAGTTASPNATESALAPWRIERDIRRFELLNTQTLWDLLAIRPGMSILDLGTGTGQFAYAFAERLQGRGKVYATDTNSNCVRYVGEEAARRGLKNIVPALVMKDELDKFYRSDTYDVIAILHVDMDYEKEVDFLRYLGGSLAEDGRLIFAVYKGYPDFSPDDFTNDYGGLVKEILQEPAGTPFHRAFRESTRALLKASSGAAAAAGLKAIVEDFNGILANANFGLDYFDGSTFRKELNFTREERGFANWLTIHNRAEVVIRVGLDIPWITPARTTKKINKLLIVQKFRKYLRTERLYSSGLSPADRNAISRAGYALHREYADSIPFEDVFIFTRSH